MQHSEISTGDELYLDPSPVWRDAPYLAMRAVVVDATPRTILDPYGEGHVHQLDPGGDAVLVQPYGGLDQALPQVAVRVAYLRGSWRTTCAEVEAAAAPQIQRALAWRRTNGFGWP